MLLVIFVLVVTVKIIGDRCSLWDPDCLNYNVAGRKELEIILTKTSEKPRTKAKPNPNESEEKNIKTETTLAK